MTAPLLDLYFAERADDDGGRVGRERRVVVRASEPAPADDAPFQDGLGARLRVGDESAFTAVIAATVPSLIRYASVRLGMERDAAEDVVQEMFARLWMNRETIPDRVTRGYLFRIVHNAVLNIVAHNRVASAHAAQTTTTTPSTSDTGAALDTSLTLRRLLTHLPDRRRQAIELRYWGHLSYAELAEVLGTTSANAERIVARALVQLQQLAAELA